MSKGAIPGVAAGAKLMPIKVLDSTNSGSELDLIDALAHAVTNGADVINLSLAFPLGYAPSVELQEALHDAWAADVVMVAAAGNDGADELAWPAASPLVISVGSVRSNATNGTHLAAYSNRGPGLDVVAPGGSLDLDVNGDGWADGVVAQTISLGNPGTISWVLYQGTSQSAALVSGTVLRMLKDGDAPDTIRARLQTGAFSAPNLLSSGSGSPRLNVTSARASTASGGRYTAGAMGFVRRFTVNGQVEIEPTLRVVAMDPTGARLDAGEVVVRIVDEDGVRWDSCTVGVGDGGMCEIVAGRYTDPAVSPDAWIYTVAAVVDGGVGHRPTRALFASDAGEAILAAVEAANVDPDRSLAVYWPQGVDPELGSLHEAFSVTTTGSFLADAPVVTTFTRSHVATQITQENNVPLDLEGTGVITFPTEGWGFMAKQVDLDGGGVGGLGGRLAKLLFLNGSAYASGDLGWHGAHMFAYHDGVIAPNHDEVGVNGEVVDLFDPIVSGPLLGTHIAGLVTSGGRIAADGYEEAVALPAAGALTIGRLAGVATPTGAGEVSVWMMDDDNAE